MKLKCLGSGSSGNGYLLIASNGETLIIDPGIPIKEIKKALNWNVSCVVGAVCTHHHTDHAKSVKDLEQMGIPVLKPYESSKKISVDGAGWTIQYFELTDKNRRFMHTNTDGSECPCYGFLISHPEMGRLLYITDTELIKWRFYDIHQILVDYIKSKADTMSDQMIVHVVSPTQVNLFSNLDSDRIRECMVEVHAELPEFPFNKFVDHEDFIIGVQAKFIPNNDSDLLLKFAGTVEGGTIADYGDDGVSQKATVKTGLASKSDAIIPSPVTLKPYRTFTEVEQPESQFVFRMKEDKYDGVQCALFEADGGAWKLHAMESIQEYLEEQLKGVDGFTIIS